MKQTISLFVLGLKLLKARPTPGIIIIVGVAGLTAVAVSITAISSAFEKALAGTGKTDRALVLRAGSTAEINGNVPLGQHPLIQEMPEVAQRNNLGIASRETYVTVNIPQRGSDVDATLPMRGVDEQSFIARKEVTVVAGEKFTAGKYELIAGVKAAQLFAGLEPGNTLWIRGQQWLVRGLFSAAGSAYETEIWVDERVLAQALGRGETFSAALVQLRSPADFESFKARLANDRRLTVAAHRESDYYAAQAASTSGLMQGLGWLVGSIMALGALVAAFNTMQSALHSRTREIASLRALGFERAPLLAAIVLECVTLSLTGAGLAVASVYLLLDGTTLSTVAAATTSNAQVAFRFEINTDALMLAAGLAIALGVLGGLIPGIGTVRRPLIRALRGN